MSEQLIDRVRVQAEEVCAEVDEIEAKVDHVSSGARASYEKRLVELRRRCESAEARLGDLEWGEESWKETKSGLLGLLSQTKARIDRLRTGTHAGESSGSPETDEVCTDELDKAEERDPGSLQGTVLGTGGAAAGLTPLDDPPDSRER